MPRHWVVVVGLQGDEAGKKLERWGPACSYAALPARGRNTRPRNGACSRFAMFYRRPLADE